MPIQSYNYRTVGIVIKMNPRVTFENEIVMNIEVENSTLGNDRVVAGQLLPTFGTRKVKTRMRLREGESNLLAGLVREQDRRVLTGFPGLLRVPIIKDIFGGTEELIEQTDIVILLTPRIVRSHELTQENLNPIYIGSQVNLGLTGPAPIIATPPEPEPAQPVEGQPPCRRPRAGRGASAACRPRHGALGDAAAGLASSDDDAGNRAGPARNAAAAAAAGAESPVQVAITTPGPSSGSGGGPYIVPISVIGASRLSLVSLSVTFNAAALRVRSVQEGPFLRQGGATVAFTNQVDPHAGRVDISMTRSADVIGASGTGQLAALVLDAIAPGTSPLTVSGVATSPDGRTIPLTFVPASVTIK